MGARHLPVGLGFGAGSPIIRIPTLLFHRLFLRVDAPPARPYLKHSVSPRWSHLLDQRLFHRAAEMCYGSELPCRQQRLHGPDVLVTEVNATQTLCVRENQV